VWTGNRRKAPLQHGDDFCRILHRQSGLRDIGQLGVFGWYQLFGVGNGFNQNHCACWQLPHGPDHFGMTLMTDEKDRDCQYDVNRGRK